MGDTIGQSQPRGERLARPHVGLGEVADGHATPELDGQRAGGTAEPATDVEDARARLEPRQPREPLGRAFAAAVELVGRRQVVDRHRADVLAGGGQRVEDPALETVASPVGIRRAGVAHARFQR